MTHEQLAGPMAGLKVLVIEDEYFLAQEICRALGRSGAVVVGPFRDLADGSVAVEKNADLSGAILDVNLNGAMVFPIADVLRERGTPFVFTTGYDGEAIPTTYRDVPRCEKPVDADEVLLTLMNCRV